MSLHVTPVAGGCVLHRRADYLSPDPRGRSLLILGSRSQRTDCRVAPPTSPPAPSPTCSPRPAQTQTHCFHTYAPFTPESHQITFEARPTLSLSLSAAALFIRACPGSEYERGIYINSHSRLCPITILFTFRRRPQRQRSLRASFIQVVLILSWFVISVST